MPIQPRDGCQFSKFRTIWADCEFIGEPRSGLLGSRGSADRMIAARFQAPLAMLDGRKRFIVRIEEVDGKSFEYSER